MNIPGLDQSAAEDLDELLASLPEDAPISDKTPPETAPAAVEALSRALPPRGVLETTSEIERRWQAQRPPAVPRRGGKPQAIEQTDGPLSWMR